MCLGLTDSLERPRGASNRRTPVNISNRRQPTPRCQCARRPRPLRLVPAPYGRSVPRSVPFAVDALFDLVGTIEPAPAAEECRTLAMPKSSSFTPVRVTITLAGFRSRWTMPASCAASRAPATSRAIASASAGSRRPCANRAASVSPSSYRERGNRCRYDTRDRFHVADMWVIQLRDGASLTLESNPQVGIAADVCRHNLERDIAVQACIYGFVDLAHAAGADGGDNLIAAEASAWGKRHLSGEYMAGDVRVTGPSPPTTALKHLSRSV